MKDELNESVDNMVNSPDDNEQTNEQGIELLHAPSEVDTEEKSEGVTLLTPPSVEEDEDLVTLLTPPSLEEESKVEDKPSPSGEVVVNEKGKEKLFQKFTSKDIVFLSIMAGCTLLTSAVMPLALTIPVFGIIHLMLSFQMTFFPALGLTKVKKPGALLYMVAVFSLVPIFIMPPIGLGGLICALLAEVITLLIFRSYKKDIACIFASALYFPLGLPLMYGYYKIIYANGVPNVDADGEPIKDAVKAMINVEPGFAVGICVAVIAICIVAAILGALTFRKLKKSGAIKK